MEGKTLALTESLPQFSFGRILFIFVLNFKNSFIYFCARSSLVAASGGYSLVTACRLLTEVASLVVEHGVQSGRASVVVELGLSGCGAWA